MTWLVLVVLTLVCCDAVAARRPWTFVPALLLVLPVLRNGPLDVDLARWKLVFVLLLLALTVLRTPPAHASAVPATHRYLLACGALAGLVSFALATRRDLSVPMMQAYLTSVLFLGLCWTTFEIRTLRWGIRSVIVMTVGICVIACVQYATIRFHRGPEFLLRMLSPEARAYYFEMGNDLGSEGVRLASVFYHPNQLGHVLGLSFGFLFALFMNARSGLDRSILAIALAAIVAGVFLTLSRGAVLIVGLEFLIILALMRGPAMKKLLTLAAALSVPLVVALTVLGNVAPLLSRVRHSGLSFRMSLWSNGARLAPFSLPFGFGPGGSSFQMLTRFPVLDNADLLNSYYIGHAYNPWGAAPHDYYITTFIEAGLFSFVFRLLLYVAITAAGVRLIRTSRHAIHRSVAIAVTVPLSCEFLRGLFDSYDFLSAMESGSIVAFFLATVTWLSVRPGRASTSGGSGA